VITPPQSSRTRAGS